MGHSMKALPTVIVILLGLASLAFGISGLMTTEPAFGQLGNVAAIGGFLAAALVTLRVLANS